MRRVQGQVKMQLHFRPLISSALQTEKEQRPWQQFVVEKPSPFADSCAQDMPQALQAPFTCTGTQHVRVQSEKA